MSVFFIIPSMISPILKMFLPAWMSRSHVVQNFRQKKYRWRFFETTLHCSTHILHKWVVKCSLTHTTFNFPGPWNLVRSTRRFLTSRIVVATCPFVLFDMLISPSTTKQGTFLTSPIMQFTSSSIFRWTYIYFSHLSQATHLFSWNGCLKKKLASRYFVTVVKLTAECVLCSWALQSWAFYTPWWISSLSRR